MKTRIVLLTLAAAICLVGGVMAFGLSPFGDAGEDTATNSQSDSGSATDARIAPAAAAKPVRGIRALPENGQIKLAMQAVFPSGVAQRMNEEGEVFIYEPGKLVWTSFGPVLIAPASNENAAPVTMGALGVFHLREEGGKFVVGKSWPEHIGGSIMGNPPEWRVSDEFGDEPVIVSTAGGVWQGYACQTTTLHALDEGKGLRELASFQSYYSNSGAKSDGEVGQTIEGKIENIVKNKSFDVRFTGTSEFMAYFVKSGTGGAYTRPLEGPQIPSC